MTTPDVPRVGNGSGKITREAVLAAALEIIDRDGADALSMRRLAPRPGPGPDDPLPARTAFLASHLTASEYVADGGNKPYI